MLGAARSLPSRQAEGHAQSLPLENLLGTIRSGQSEAYRHSPDEVPRRFNEGGALTREEIQRGGALTREVIQRGALSAVQMAVTRDLRTQDQRQGRGFYPQTK